MKKKKFNIWELLLFLVVFVVFLFSLYKVVTITLEYKAGQDEYASLESFVEIKEEPAATTQKAEEIQKESDVAAVEKTEQKQEEIVMRYHDGFVDMTVDFQALQEINDDFTGWLYVPGVSISYPLVLGDDNDYYLTHTFKKEENKSGAIFLDQVTANPFEDYNTVIHGHNMKDGSMFGRLKGFYNNTQTYANNPYFYIYTADKTYKYLIFSYYVTTDTSAAYVIPYTEESLRDYKNQVMKNAVYKDVDGIPDVAPIVTLSTCHGANYTDARFVVHGILVDTK